MEALLIEMATQFPALALLAGFAWQMNNRLTALAEAYNAIAVAVAALTATIAATDKDD